ncbi:hypothetical protein EVAR_6657_1 [Eumeta japonica]|uniref:Uncharacterized protein n=1 Tax=Eumeta variegata TaxID=151549 RepID=A0A4C1TNC1_EUMVA|nr:hypothetical protein EVAR_6657_1 [Eumeta japonica]
MLRSDRPRAHIALNRFHTTTVVFICPRNNKTYSLAAPDLKGGQLGHPPRAAVSGCAKIIMIEVKTSVASLATNQSASQPPEYAGSPPPGLSSGRDRLTQPEIANNTQDIPYFIYRADKNHIHPPTILFQIDGLEPYAFLPVQCGSGLFKTTVINNVRDRQLNLLPEAVRGGCVDLITTSSVNEAGSS